MNDHIKVSFWLRKSRLNTESKAPVIMRLIVGPDRKDKHIGQYVYPKDWDTAKGRLFSKNPTNNVTNELLDQIYYKVIKIFNRLISDYETVTLEDLVNAYENKDATSHTLLELIKHHNQDFLSRTNIDRTKSTYEKYRFTDLKVRYFIWDKYNIKDISLNKLTLQFAKDFYAYMLTTDGISHNTVAKYIKNLKRVINYGVELEWIKTNPLALYKIGYKETEQVILSENELAAICKTSFDTPRLQLAKDLFVFQCYTGLSYNDIYELTPENISTGSDGSQWIYTTRSKTGTRAAIPLFNQAKEIIEQYQKTERRANKNRLFPGYQIQTMNDYLKKIAEVSGIKKNLTTHVGRRTFATTVLLHNGTPIEVISKVLGHLNISTTQIYAKVSDFLVKKEIDKVNKFLSNNNPHIS